MLSSGPWFMSFNPLKEQIEFECSGAPVALVGGFDALPGGPVLQHQ